MDNAQETQIKEETQIKTENKGATAPSINDRKPISLEEASAIAERLERANADYRQLVERQEQVRAQQMLGGRAEAGIAPLPVKEDTPQEYAKKLHEGKLQFK